MMRFIVVSLSLYFFCVSSTWAESSERVVDIPTRLGVTQRFLLIKPENPKAAIVLFAGSHGGLQISPDGEIIWGKNNFLVRTRKALAANDLMVVVVDAPSDRQRAPYLSKFRGRPEHVADIKALIAWLKQQADVPVWLAGISRGTESAAFIATQLSLAAGGPDGIVLLASMIKDDEAVPVSQLPLEKITVPTLVIHHKKDRCKYSSYKGVPRLMKKLNNVSKKELIAVDGGKNRGDPCEPFGYHGFTGIERNVVDRMREWIDLNKS